MHIEDIFEQNSPFTQQQLKKLASCTQFLKESEGLPLLKGLPTAAYSSFAKIKVRHRKQKGAFTETFNNALDVIKLRQRAIFANSPTQKYQYYIFPTNKYRFVYSEEVQDSGEEYKNVFESLLDKFDQNPEKAIAITTDLLKYTYTDKNLAEGIQRKSEIIIYNVPFYYAVKQSIVNYDNLLEFIGRTKWETK